MKARSSLTSPTAWSTTRRTTRLRSVRAAPTSSPTPSSSGRRPWIDEAHCASLWPRQRSSLSRRRRLCSPLRLLLTAGRSRNTRSPRPTATATTGSTYRPASPALRGHWSSTCTAATRRRRRPRTPATSTASRRSAASSSSIRSRTSRRVERAGRRRQRDRVLELVPAAGPDPRRRRASRHRRHHRPGDPHTARRPSARLCRGRLGRRGHGGHPRRDLSRCLCGRRVDRRLRLRDVAATKPAR